MSGSNVSIDGKRLLADLYRLREFGTYKTGVHRPTYSPVDMQSRQWLMERMRDAGLETRVDAAGNLIGRRAGRVGLPASGMAAGAWLSRPSLLNFRNVNLTGLSD